MPIDKVRPLAMENPADGGTELYPIPTEIDPDEDYLSLKGIAFEELDTHLIDIDGNDIMFTDPAVGTVSVDEIRSTARVSSNDTTPSYLYTKIIDGPGTTIDQLYDGGDERLRITSLFGTEFYFQEDETESQTTSTTYVEKMSMTLTDIPAGTYYFGGFFNAKNPIGNSKEMGVRIQQDDSITLWESTVIDSDGEYTIVCGFDFLTFSAGSHQIDIDFKSISGTAYIANTRFIFWRIA